MRLFAATLLALCACNQVYGLDPTTVAPPPDASDRQVRLSMLVGGATETAMEAPAMLVDVAPDPMPRVALFDQPLVARDYGAGGVVGYPHDFLGTPWRLEYTPPDGVPVEVQWSPPANAGHIIVPVVGRVVRTQVPTGTGYIVRVKKLDQTFHTFVDPAVYTTGYWSATPATGASTTLGVDFSVAPSMSGPAGAPSAAAKDVVVALDYTVDAGTGCRYASRAGSGLASELENGMMKPLDLPIDTSAGVVVLTYIGEPPTDAQARLLSVLGARGDDATGSRAIYGRFAHTAIPAFTTMMAGVPAPAMIPLATCPVLVQTTPSTSDAGGALSFTKGMFSYVTNDRTVSGVRLRSSIATVGVVASGSTYEATFDVPLATKVQLGAKDLVTADGGLIASTPSDLAIAVEAGRPFDYVEVVLYKLTASSLEPVRTYVGTTLGTEVTLRFDPSVMTPNAEHVFAIRTYRGRPGARQADFATVQGAQAVGTIFTRTFRR